MSLLTVTVGIEVCDAETDKAIHCVMADTQECVWIPRSVLADVDIRDDEFKGDEDFELEIYEWFAKKEDLV